MFKERIKSFLGYNTKPNLFADMESGRVYLPEGTNPIFVSGTGRSGTHFFAKLFEPCPEVSSYHLDDVGDSIGDSFEIFRQWHRLPISNDGFLNSRGYLIQESQIDKRRFVESNPLIALSMLDLRNRFGGKFIVTVRNPRNVVESHFNKGWYKKIPSSNELDFGYQYFHDRPNHYFSRLLPKVSPDREDWLTMSRLGKIAWMWRITYQRIFDQLAKFPKEEYKVVYLDSFDYSAHVELFSYLEIGTMLSEDQFDDLLEKRPGKSSYSAIPWDENSRKAFNTEISKTIPLFQNQLDTSKWLFD
ncbi:MAG: hypothetical protein AAFX87_19300 [Bacteroidota bacterium]